MNAVFSLPENLLNAAAATYLLAFIYCQKERCYGKHKFRQKTKPEYYPFKLTLSTGQTIEIKIKMNEIMKILCGYPKNKIQVFQCG